MTKEQYTRWMCFVEIFHILEERGIKIDATKSETQNVFDGKEIEKYIEARYYKIYEKLEREGFDKELVTNEMPNL